MHNFSDKSKIPYLNAGLAVLKEPVPADKDSISGLFWHWRMLVLAYSCPADNEQIYETIHEKQNAARDKMLLLMPHSAADLAMQLLIATAYGHRRPPKRLVHIAELLAQQ